MAHWKSRRPETQPWVPLYNGRWLSFPPRAAERTLRAVCKAPLGAVLRAAGGEPSYPPGASLGHQPPPPCLCEVTAARDLPLICPFIALHTIRGSLEGYGVRADGKQREKTKALLRGGQKAGCVLPVQQPGQPGPPAPGPGRPQAAGHLRPAPPR